LVCAEDYRRLHSLCHSDGVDGTQLAAMLARLLRGARNGFGELPLSHLESQLDMPREVVQTALSMLADVPDAAGPAADDGFAPPPPRESAAGDALGEEAEHVKRGPLIELLPEIKRTATLSFHRHSAEAVAAQSPLVAMMLKTAKLTNGAHKCNLVHAAAELGLDAHAVRPSAAV
jgi:hypothetical protein